MMEQQIIVLLCACVWGVLTVDHAELRGELSHPDEIDNGQCVPMPCIMGVPPKECTRLCALRHYIPICKPPADLCLCQHLVNGKLELVSPDEVTDQPPEPTETEPKADSVSYSIFAIFLPIKDFIYDTSAENGEGAPQPTADPLENAGYESVNVHEGRLFWDFRYILTGLFLLMIGLVVYELMMCVKQVYGPKRELSVKCEPVEKVIPALVEKEKIFNV